MQELPATTPLGTAAKAARRAAILGLLLGIVYSIGGLFADLATTGLNGGTALAFLALVGMPAIFATIGFACGGLWAVLARAAN